MDKQKKIFLLLALFLLFFMALLSYFYIGKPLAKKDDEIAVAQNTFLIGLESNQSFLYTSELNVNLSKDEELVKSTESIKLIKQNDSLHFKKYTDPYHFFELINVSDDFALRNTNGAWRKIVENHAWLNELVFDGCNGLNFLFSEFDLKKVLSQETKGQGKNKKFLLKGQIPIPKNYESFLANKNLSVKGKIETSNEGLPLNALITIITSDKSLELEYKMNLDLNYRDKIVFPETKEDIAHEQIVNLSSKFLDLLNNFKE